MRTYFSTLEEAKDAIDAFYKGDSTLLNGGSRENYSWLPYGVEKDFMSASTDLHSFVVYKGRYRRVYSTQFKQVIKGDGPISRG